MPPDDTGPADLATTVSIAILTYRRPEGVDRTIRSLVPALQPPSPVGEIVVIDNDGEPTAEATIARIAAELDVLPLRYVHEPRPGLAAARNRALDEAKGRVLVFIDDDEVAGPGWPDGLIEVIDSTGAALVGGPVRNRFDTEPDPAIAAVMHRPEPAEGSRQRWLRSGNLAIDLEPVRSRGLRFDDAFGATGGEDVAFSWAARASGLDLRWTNRAIVHEYVGADRTTLRWIMRRSRTATINWARVELLHHPSLLHRALVMARGGARIAQGLGLAALGLLGRDRARIARGSVLAARGVGSVQGAAGRAVGTYR